MEQYKVFLKSGNIVIVNCDDYNFELDLNFYLNNKIIAVFSVDYVEGFMKIVD